MIWGQMIGKNILGVAKIKRIFLPLLIIILILGIVLLSGENPEASGQQFPVLLFLYQVMGAKSLFANVKNI
jgi:hypothetical protein